MGLPSRTRIISFLIALGFTLGLLYYLSLITSFSDWLVLFKNLQLPFLFLYLMLFFLGMALRAFRYQILLKASSVPEPPSWLGLFLLTFINNLFIDLLPARSGSLAYIVFLNQKFKVALGACVSSFAFSFIFDLLGILPLLFLALLFQHFSLQAADPWLWIFFALLFLVSLLILSSLEKWVALAGRIFRGLSLKRLAGELASIKEDILRVKGKKIYGTLIALSVAIRFFKYFALYLLILGLAGQWGEPVLTKLSFPLILFALIAAEATASLPISGLAGFGAYEGVLMALLYGAGLSAHQSSLLAFGLHLTTQALDYSLGGLSLLSLTLMGKRGPSGGQVS